MSIPSELKTAPTWSDRARKFVPSPRYGSVLVSLVLLVVMYIVGVNNYRNFDFGDVLTVFINNSYLIVLAVGMTFVILTGGIDLSVGSIVALSTMIAASLLQAGWHASMVLVIVLVVGSVVGLISGLVIHYFQIQPFIVTLAMMFLARGFCYVISTSSIPISDPFFTWMARTRIPLGEGLATTPSVIVALIVVVVAVVVLHYTRMGRTVYAIGGGEHSAVLMGLPVSRTKVYVYVISGFCAALGGLLFTFYKTNGDPITAIGMELDAIAAVVIGGTLLTGGYGFVLGSLLGVLLLGFIQTFILRESLGSWWTRIIIASLLLAFILLQRLLTVRRR